jgi:hypothetical protein
VLAVNHVVEILTLRASGLDWTSVLTKVMPQRREATARGDADGQEVGQEEGEEDGGEEDGGGDEIGQKQDEEWEEGGAT